MGNRLVQEVTSVRPLRAGPEWWLLVDMALDADDTTRRTACGYEYMSRRTQAPRSTIYRWLKKLTDAGLVATVEHSRSGGRGGRPGRRAVYEIQTGVKMPSMTADEANAMSTPSLSSVPRRPPPDDPQFDEFWSVYPRKVGKVGAQRAWERVTRKGAAPRRIIAAAERFRDYCRANRIDQKFIPHPASWLRDGRYGDEEVASGSPAAAVTPPPPAGRLDDEKLLAAVIRLTADQDRPISAATAIIAAVRQCAPSTAMQFPAVTKERGHELAVMMYADYLRTPEWRERRQIMLQQADRRCQVCNGTDRLNVHHRTYERRGAENPSDLVVLCEDCHKLFHDNGRLAVA